MHRRPSLTPCSRAAGKPALIRSSDELLINLLIRLSYGNAGIAQLVEQLICNQQVVGSNPTAGSIHLKLCLPSEENLECRRAGEGNLRCCADVGDPKQSKLCVRFSLAGRS